MCSFLKYLLPCLLSKYGWAQSNFLILRKSIISILHFEFFYPASGSKDIHLYFSFERFMVLHFVIVFDLVCVYF